MGVEGKTGIGEGGIKDAVLLKSTVMTRLLEKTMKSKMITP